MVGKPVFDDAIFKHVLFKKGRSGRLKDTRCIKLTLKSKRHV